MTVIARKGMSKFPRDKAKQGLKEAAKLLREALQAVKDEPDDEEAMLEWEDVPMEVVRPKHAVRQASEEAVDVLADGAWFD